jgi:hypothetical protein
MSKALSPAHVQRLNALRTAALHQAEDDHNIVEAAKRARELPHWSVGLEWLKETDAQLAERGWTRAELHIAIDGKMPFTQMPGYMRMAHDRGIVRARASEGSDQAAPAAQGFYVGEAAPARRLKANDADEGESE